jgi:hypothetical protein
MKERIARQVGAEAARYSGWEPFIPYLPAFYVPKQNIWV